MKHLDTMAYLKFLNILDLVGICLILSVAFIFQIYLHELPCPLCLLQRAGLLGICFGFYLNVRYDIRPAHYAMSLLSAVFTMLVAMRQIALHIIPGEGSYGSAVFGLHLYTWCFLIGIITVIYTAIMLSIPNQYCRVENYNGANHHDSKLLKRIGTIAFIFVLFILIANVVSTFLECGLVQCPDNPTQYRY